ncbi:hypothetical protein Ddc_09071 [Ditylenchus destructor]|nr:hypothetical protein Ddc_09071 [Ditylenchus destructor]
MHIFIPVESSFGGVFVIRDSAKIPALAPSIGKKAARPTKQGSEVQDKFKASNGALRLSVYHSRQLIWNIVLILHYFFFSLVNTGILLSGIHSDDDFVQRHHIS